MHQEQRCDRLGFDLLAVIAGVQTEILESLVLADEIPGRVVEFLDDLVQHSAVERLFDIVDDVELDAALAQDLERATRLASAGVMVDPQTVHSLLALLEIMGSNQK
jgi:hypothetical protein